MVLNQRKTHVGRNLIIMTVMMLAIVISGRSVRAAAPTDLFFSEYIEGSSNNKALEIYNGTGASIDLTAGSYSVKMFFNGSSTSTLTINLTGTVANGDVFVLATSTADPVILAAADLTNSSGWFNGDDAVVLYKGATVLDVIGQIGTDPGAAWGTAPTSTANNTLQRKDTICTGDIDGSNVFDPATEWNGFVVDTFTGLGSHTVNCDGGGDSAPTVTSTTPVNNATDVPVADDLSVTFSEAVNVAAGGFDLTCIPSGTVALTVTGGPTTFTLNPDSDLAEGEDCTLTVVAANVTDQDTDDPPDAMASDAVVTFMTFSDVVVIPADLVINEIDYDQPGADTAEFVEIRNNDSVTVNLDDYNIQMINGNGGGAAQYQLFDLPAVNLVAGDYFVLCGNAANVANCDLVVTPAQDLIQNGATSGNAAPDAVALRLGNTVVDTVSYEGSVPAPYTEGSGDDLVDTAVGFMSISRLPDGTDTGVNNVDLSLRCSTPGVANTADTTDCDPDLPPTVTSTTPSNGALGVPLASDLTVTFSEPVNAAAGAFGLVCTTSGTVTLAVSGGPTTFTLNPASDLALNESCTLTVVAANVTDQDTDDPPDVMAADVTVTFTTFDGVDVCTLAFTPAYDIQGSGATTPIPGAVTTQGVVVGDFEGASPDLRGFFIQDPTGDANPATSDGIFIFNGSNNNDVNLGDVVRVTGTAGESNGQTQVSASTINDCSTGASVTPVNIAFPVSSATYLEQYEGMLISVPQTMFVTEHFQLGRFGQVFMSGTARLQQPTNVVAPGGPAAALQAANDLNKIIVDDPNNAQNPDPIIFGGGTSPLSAANTLRGGDTVTGMVGVMTYTWAGNSASGNAYRIRPVGSLGGGQPNFVSANPRPASSPALTGDVRITGMNLLNYFNSFSGCTGGVGGASTDCRGANNQAEFDRQWAKTVAAITGTQSDVIGIMEIENDGYGPTSAIQHLVDQLNSATAAGTYAFIDVDAETSQVNALGTDAIKVGFLYKTAAVTPVGNTAALNTTSFETGGDSAPRNRPSLAQAFQHNGSGEEFIVVANHLKSKGSACDTPDAGDGQANCNEVRTNAANELATWLAGDPTGTGDPDILIVGDLNSYAKEDPIAALETAGYTNLILAYGGPNAYSYAFDGQWGYLDHALGTASLVAQVSGVADWHINSDEPNVLDYNTEFKSAGQIVSLYAPDEFRISDHDPVLVDLSFETEAAGYCPVESEDVAYHQTDLLGQGQANRTSKLTIPNYEDVESLYGQLAALNIGVMKYVRFRYQNGTYIQVSPATSVGYKASAVSWWGSDLDSAKTIKGQFFWGTKGNKSPRAFVLWPTYATDETYADVLTVFEISNQNHVAWETEWIAEQNQIIPIPETQAAGADITVKIALVDVNKDNRPIILTVSANGVSQQLIVKKPNAGNLLNTIEIVLNNVPAGTSTVEINLLSPSPSALYPNGGDSAAMIGAAVSYPCDTPDPR